MTNGANMQTTGRGSARNLRFGQLLNEGLHSVVSRRSTSSRPVKLAGVKIEIWGALAPGRPDIQPNTPDGWCRGYVPRVAEDVAWLARYVHRHGRLARSWFEEFLREGRYPDGHLLITELFEESAQSRGPSIGPGLKVRPVHVFGRDEDRKRLLAELAGRWPVLALVGMSGTGKTTLALEAAHCCLGKPSAELAQPFQFVVWLSGKE